jgi:hypothetical protein
LLTDQMLNLLSPYMAIEIDGMPPGDDSKSVRGKSLRFCASRLVKAVNGI